MTAGTWWGRAVAASAAVAVVAGTVAVVATAVGTDRERARPQAAELTTTAEEGPAVAPAAPVLPPGRAGAPELRATVALAPGFTVVGGQDLVPVPPGRFPTVVTLEGRAVVLVGGLETALEPGSDALADETVRLVDEFTDAVLGSTAGDEGSDDEGSDDGDVETLSEGPDSLDGREAFTAVRRIETADGPGAIVRVTTVAGTPELPGLVLLAAAAPGPDQDAEADAADAVVRSLSSAPGDVAAVPVTPPGPGSPPSG